MIDGVRPVPGVALPQLAVLVVAPAPGLPGLVHHDHVARVLAAAHVPDPRALQRRQPHRLVDVVLGVVAVLLQLAGLQGLKTFMSHKIQLLGSPEHLYADRKYLPNSHFATPWCRRTASRRTRDLALPSWPLSSCRWTHSLQVSWRLPWQLLTLASDLSTIWNK